MKKLFLIAIAALALYSCNSEPSSGEATAEETSEETTEAAAAATPELISEVIENEGTINMACADLWTSVKTFGGLDDVHPDIISACVVEGEGVGAIRTLTLADGTGDIVEELLKLDDENMVMGYKMISSPMPVEDYKGMWAQTDGDGNCIVKWTSKYKVSPDNQEAMSTSFNGLHQKVFEDINAFVAAM